MKVSPENQAIPKFIVKSTLGIALISAFILTPFSIYNYIQRSYLLGGLISIAIILCAINAWLCNFDQYHKGINLFGITPVITIAIVIAIYKLGVIGSYWAYLGVLSFYFILPEKEALIVNIIFIFIILPVSWNTLEVSISIRFTAVLFGTSIYAFLAIREITRQHFLLREQAITDPLTGLYNRSLVEYSLEHTIHISTRTRIPMALLMLDLDHFKKINDEFGHDKGDDVLKAVGHVLKNNFRESDMVFRIGGEEFLIVLYNTIEKSSINIAEKLRKKIEELKIIPHHTVTISIGISTLQSDYTWQKWMKHCDLNLYQAKNGGRNKVVF